MKSNKNYFIEELNVSADAFQARPEAQTYWQRKKNEKALIDFIDKKFVIDLDKAKEDKVGEIFFKNKTFFKYISVF